MEAGDAVMIEDTLVNLQIPHKMGMATIYVRHGRSPESPPPGYLHMSCDNTINALQAIKNAGAA